MAEAVRIEDGALRAAAPLYDRTLGQIIDSLESHDLPSLPDGFFIQFEAYFEPLSDLLGEALLASYLLGLDHARENLGFTQFAEFAEKPEPEPVGFSFDVEPREAVEHFRAKRVVTRKRFDGLSAEARDGAFTVTDVYKRQVLDGFKAEIENALSQGTAQTSVIKRFREVLAGAGHRELGAFHLETIFRVNQQRAYGVGRRHALESVSEDLPYWEYHTAGDDRVRPRHAVLNNIVLPANHEFWRTHFAPWDFNCRCAITAVDGPPAGYDHSNPSGLGEIFYDERGLPAKAEIGTAVYDLAVGDFRGIPPGANLREVIVAGAERARARGSGRVGRSRSQDLHPLDRILNRTERDLARRRTEKAVVLDTDGRLIIQKSSRSLNEVSFEPDEAEQFRGKILTHNHPGNTSFSRTDVEFAMRTQLAEIRSVGRRYRYSLRPPTGGWSEESWRQIEPTVNEVIARRFVEFTQEVRAGRIPQEEFDTWVWHRVWQEVAERTGLAYERTEWK